MFTLVPRLIVQALGVGLLILGAGGVNSQDYPNKPVRIITSGAGGGSDFTARQIAQGITGPLGQPVVVDNRTGFLAAEAVSKAPADGYTVLVSGGTTWLGPLLQNAPWDAVRDFSPVVMTDKAVLIVAVHPSLPVKSIKELIALAKARPGELNYGSGPTGGSTHLALQLFKSMGGVDIVRVPYKGNAPVISALVGGEVQLTIMDVGLVAPHVTSGRLRALAITGAQPSALAPGLPTVASSGLPGYESTVMSGVFLPGKAPEPIVNRLNQEIVRYLTRAEVKERFINAGVEIVGSSPEQFAAAVKSEISMVTKVIKDAGIKADELRTPSSVRELLETTISANSYVMNATITFAARCSSCTG